MAEKKKTSRKQTKTKAAGIDVILKPGIDVPRNRVYSNFAHVSQTPYDFNIRFCDATPLPADAGAAKPIIHAIPIVAEIAIPFNVMPGLINALKTQYEVYLGSTGEKDNGKKTKK